MTIIDSLIRGKVSDEQSEDGIAVTDDFIAVIDGSTSKTPLRINPQMTNGRYAMLLLKDAVAALPLAATIKIAATRLTRALASAYPSEPAVRERLMAHPEQRLCASVVVYSRYRHEVWMIGDCQCIIGGRYFDNPKPGEAMLASIRSQMLRDALRAGATVEELRSNDVGRNAILPELVNSMKYENTKYSVVDGFKIPMGKTRCLNIRKLGLCQTQPKEIVLATDGYPFLRPTLSESEELLARQLKDDPLCIGSFKATKGWRRNQRSFDDRAYISFLV